MQVYNQEDTDSRSINYSLIVNSKNLMISLILLHPFSLLCFQHTWLDSVRCNSSKLMYIWPSIEPSKQIFVLLFPLRTAHFVSVFRLIDNNTWTKLILNCNIDCGTKVCALIHDCGHARVWYIILDVAVQTTYVLKFGAVNVDFPNLAPFTTRGILVSKAQVF